VSGDRQPTTTKGAGAVGVVTLYAAKGGQGCTTTAVALAVLVARRVPVTLVAHDPAAVLAVAGRRVEADTTPVAVAPGVVLTGDPPASAAGSLVVCDAGLAPPDPSTAGDASRGPAYLITRPCFLALRAAAAHPVRPAGVVLVDEPGRAIGLADVETVLGVPVVATVPVTPEIARVIDAGLLVHRLPAPLEHGLQPVAATLAPPAMTGAPVAEQGDRPDRPGPVDGWWDTGGGFWQVGWDPSLGSFYADLIDGAREVVILEIGPFGHVFFPDERRHLATVDELESRIGPVPAHARASLEAAQAAHPSPAAPDAAAGSDRRGTPSGLEGPGRPSGAAATGSAAHRWVTTPVIGKPAPEGRPPGLGR
jgi:hypothetical protein